VILRLRGTMLLVRISRLLNKPSGRDKIYRTVQYGLKILAQLIMLKDQKNWVVPRLLRISKTLSQTRRSMRFGNFTTGLEEFQDVVKKTYKTQWKRYLCIVESIINMLSDFYDSLCWLYYLLGLDLERVEFLSDLFWFLGLLIALFRLLRKLLFTQQALRTLQSSPHHYASPSKEFTIRHPENKLLDNRDTNTTAPLPLVSTSTNHVVTENLIDSLNKKRQITLLYLIKCIADLIHASDGVFNLEKHKLFVTAAALCASIVGLHLVWKKERGTD